MNTPSHHRVHHARNDRYLDKNYGGFLIIWDKLFGSFEAETEEASYGVTAPPNTWDPTFINFQVWRQIIRDAWEAPRFVDKLRVWFMPTGWRPEGVRPLPRGEWQRDGKEIKFQSTMLRGAKPYLILQVALGFPAMLFVTRPDTMLPTLDRVLLSLVLWVAATAWGGLLESKRWGVRLEVARLVTQAALFASFSARGLIPASWGIVAGVLALISVTWAFTLRPESSQTVLTPEAG
jgi:hypothetical protein